MRANDARSNGAEIASLRYDIVLMHQILRYTWHEQQV